MNENTNLIDTQENTSKKSSSFISNDTIAITGLVIVAIGGLVLGQENVTSVAVGAIGGYIGAKGI